MDEDSLVRKVLLNCVQPTKESLYGYIPDLDVERATEIAHDRESGRKYTFETLLTSPGDVGNKLKEEALSVSLNEQVAVSIDYEEGNWSEGESMLIL